MLAEAWVPSMISVGALGVVWATIKGTGKKNCEKIEKNEKRIDSIGREKLGKSEHVLLCENATLKINAHISGELTIFKDAIFKELREIKDKVNQGDRVL